MLSPSFLKKYVAKLPTTSMQSNDVLTTRRTGLREIFTRFYTPCRTITSYLLRRATKTSLDGIEAPSVAIVRTE